jgi:hypothetical protein
MREILAKKWLINAIFLRVLGRANCPKDRTFYLSFHILRPSPFMCNLIERKIERGPFANFGFSPDTSAMALDNSLGYCQINLKKEK